MAKRKPVEKFGKWELATRITRNLNGDITKELTTTLKLLGSKGEKRMKLYIRNQEGLSAKGEYKWDELDDAYKTWKENKNLSNKILMATTEMWQSITSVAIFPKVYIGLKRGVKNKEGDDLVLISAVMEFGSEERNVKARPFVRPVADEIMKEVTENNWIGRRMLAHIRKKYNI